MKPQEYRDKTLEVSIDALRALAEQQRQSPDQMLEEIDHKGIKGATSDLRLLMDLAMLVKHMPVLRVGTASYVALSCFLILCSDDELVEKAIKLDPDCNMVANQVQKMRDGG